MNNPFRAGARGAERRALNAERGTPNEAGTNFGISIGLAFVGGFADAASFSLAHTFTGHLTGNCVLAAVSAASKEWNLVADRLLAVTIFLAGIGLSLTLGQFIPSRLKRYSLAISIGIEVVLILSASLFLAYQANNEMFILTMCFALGIQNDALRKTNGISVHSTYMTGMVTTLIQKGFEHLFPKQSTEEESTNRSIGVAIQILAPMWFSFIVGAVAGAVLVVSFHSGGLLVVVLLLVILMYAELKSAR
jgi:uncharacterized membrane protein YoaK (UPF0700 family)